MKFGRISYKFVSTSSNLFLLLLHCLMSTPPFSICALHTAPPLQVPFFAWLPDIWHHTKRKYKPRPRLPEEHGELPGGTGGDRPAGTGGGQTPSEAGSVRSEGSRRSGGSAGTGSEASTAAGHVAREAVVPMPSRDDLGEAHTDATLAAMQPDPALTQKVPPGPHGRQRHLTAVWDVVLEFRGVQGTFRVSFRCPIVVTGGSNLPELQVLPIMTDLTASDGTLFESHLNGLNHRKNSNGAVEFI